jgi:hypothetical protein
MTRIIARTDSNQQRIINALRRAGATVRCIHQIGHGMPDILVGYRGRNYLMEIKTYDGYLTEAERLFAEMWEGEVAIVKDEEEALNVIGKEVY